jgi:hypothetical protein
MTADDTTPCFGKSALFDSAQRADHIKAKAICATCPIIDACRKLDVSPEFVGTWAGIGYRIYPERQSGPLVHGTVAGYRKHIRRGDLPCDDCYLAHSEYQKARGRKKRAAA